MPQFMLLWACKKKTTIVKLFRSRVAGCLSFRRQWMAAAVVADLHNAFALSAAATKRRATFLFSERRIKFNLVTILKTNIEQAHTHKKQHKFASTKALWYATQPHTKKKTTKICAKDWSCEFAVDVCRRTNMRCTSETTTNISLKSFEW